MSPNLRTRIDAVEPDHVSLTQAGRARIRVQGSVLGFLWCAGQRRTAWGRFDETFLASSAGPTLVVKAFGLGGGARVSIPFQPSDDIRTPEAPSLRRLRFLPFGLPGVTPLTSQLLKAVAEASARADAAPGEPPAPHPVNAGSPKPLRSDRP